MFDDEETTLTIPVVTMAELAAQWEVTFAEVATSDRPTRPMRAVKPSDG